MLLKTWSKISEPYDNPFWEKSNRIREKKKKRNNAANSGHLVPWQRTQAARTKTTQATNRWRRHIYVRCTQERNGITVHKNENPYIVFFCKHTIFINSLLFFGREIFWKIYATSHFMPPWNWQNSTLIVQPPFSINHSRASGNHI